MSASTGFGHAGKKAKCEKSQKPTNGGAAILDQIKPMRRQLVPEWSAVA
jgi:hypothetical protein